MTIDAMGTQTTIAQVILDKRADDLLAPKDGWSRLAEVRRLFSAAPGTARLDTHATTDLDHGRSESLHRVVCQDVDSRSAL